MMLPLRDYFSGIKKIIDLMPVDRIEEVIAILQAARLNGKQVFIMGNGGSALIASHFVCDLAKKTRVSGWPNFRVIGLTDNVAVFSDYANDKGYESVFAEQLNNLVESDDVVIGISATGNCQNVINGIALANERGAKTISFVGLDGGKLSSLAQTCIHVPSNRVDQAEDIHVMLEHMISDALARQAEFINSLGTKEFGQTNADEGNEKLLEGLFGQSFQLADLPHDISSENSDSQALLTHISQEFATKLDLHNLLLRILSLTVNYMGALSGSIVVLDETGQVIDGASAYPGMVDRKPAELFTEMMQNGLAGWVVENRKPAIVENTEVDPRWLRRDWEKSRAAISIPLMTMDRVTGVLTLTRMATQQFNMEDLSLLSAITLTLSYSFSLNQENRGV